MLVVARFVLEHAEEGDRDATLGVGQQVLPAIAAVTDPTAVGLQVAAIAQPLARRGEMLGPGGPRLVDEGAAADRLTADAEAPRTKIWP